MRSHYTGSMTVLHFFPFQLNTKNFAEIRRRPNRGSNGVPNLANTSLVGISNKTDMWKVFPAPNSTNDTLSSSQTGQNTSPQEDAFRDFSAIRQSLQSQGVPAEAVNIILQSWRNSTKKQYNTYIQKWFSFCGKRINPIRPSVNSILAFFVILHRQGLKYSAFQTARSAINNLTKICGNFDFGNNNLIKRFMTGIFTERPSLPKYKTVWDVDIVLKYTEKLQDTTLLQLSCKLSVLFLLLTAQRCQTLHLIELQDIEFQLGKVIIHTNHILKQTKPGHQLQHISLQQYDKNPNICIVKVLKEYIERTEVLRNGEQKLLISTQKPHKAISNQTVSRWVKIVLRNSGIHNKYGAHSTRAASTSAARIRGVSLTTIINTAGWKGAKTFAQFYNKTIDSQEKTVQEAVLN